jgi:hypothetical protein
MRDNTNGGEAAGGGGGEGGDGGEGGGGGDEEANEDDMFDEEAPAATPFISLTPYRCMPSFSSMGDHNNLEEKGGGGVEEDADESGEEMDFGDEDPEAYMERDV